MINKISKLTCILILIFCSTNLFAQTGDTDGDGMLDSDDLCPTTFGTKSNKGCPDENQNQQKISSTKSFGFVYKTNEKDSVLVDFVFEKSPADVAGIEVGDLIQSINNINVLQKPKKEVFEIIKNLPNENVKIILSRNGLQKDFSIQKVEKSVFANICLSGNCKNGNGVFQDSIGNKYDGYFKNGNREGNGKMYYVRYGDYEGNWANGIKSGKGKFTFKDGSEYNGDWKKDVYEGNGELKWVSGHKYNGTWVNDKKSGYGTFTWPNGNTYTGDFLNGKYEGKGNFKFANGDVYVGNFKNEKFDGYGELKKTDGAIKKGMWVANVFQDNAIAKSNTGDVKNEYTLEQMNADAKKYNSSTAQKIDEIQKYSEELEKSEPFSDEDINVFKKQNPNVGNTDVKLKEVKVKEETETQKLAKKYGIKIEKPTDKEVKNFADFANSSAGAAFVKDLNKTEELDYAKIAEAMAIPYLQQNKFEEAIRFLNPQIKSYPNYAPMYNLRGIAKKGLKDFNNAILDFTQAIKLAPNNAEYYLNRAITKSANEDNLGAIPDYDQALLKGATDKKIYLNRGMSKSKAINKDAGCSDFKIAKDAQINGAERAYQICGCK